LLGRFNGDRLEVFEPRGAAEFSAADASAAQEAGLISDADLAHFDTNVQAMRQILDQLAKIDTPFRCEEKGRLTPV
jgi:hypothetical protein